MASPSRGFVKLLQRSAYGLRVALTKRQLGLSMKSGQRRAQLMRRIAHKAAMRCQCTVQARQQCVDAINQRAHFARYALGLHWAQVLVGAAAHLQAKSV